MIDWLAEFEQNVADRPNSSCSCSKDCDRERLAAFNEIQRLRAVQRRPPRRWWRWGYRV